MSEMPETFSLLNRRHLTILGLDVEVRAERFLLAVRAREWLMMVHETEAYNVKRQWCLGESRWNRFAALWIAFQRFFSASAAA